MFPVGLGWGRGGNCRWAGSGGDKRKALLGGVLYKQVGAPSLPWWPLDWRSGWSAPPEGTGCQTPTRRQRQGPRRPRSSRNSKEPAQVQVCAFLARQQPPPPPSRDRLSEGIMQNKEALFPPPGIPGCAEAFSVRGRIREQRAGWIPA